MVIFPIVFSYKGESYTAKVHRIGSGPVQYHVYDITPTIPNFPHMFIISVNQEKDNLTYAVDPHDYPVTLGGAIAASIFDECEQRGIAVFE